MSELGEARKRIKELEAENRHLRQQIEVLARGLVEILRIAESEGRFGE